MVSQLLDEYRVLHEAIYNCTLCQEQGFSVERVQPEWDASKFHSVHKWGMLIGQAPGIRERETHKAFTGKTGKGWRRWFLDVGFTNEEIKEHIFQTAITKCFPGRHNGHDRKPTKAEIKLCSPFLREQIRLIKPNVLIPLGKVAITWFFPEVNTLEEVVGKQLHWKQDAEEYRVICLPHASPASAWWKSQDHQVLIRDSMTRLWQLFQNR